MPTPTIEEIKKQVSNIEARLRCIEQREERIITVLDHLTTKMDAQLSSFSTWSDKLDKMLVGTNGSPGLMLRVDRLEQAHERTRWFIRAFGGALISVALGAAYALVK